jgi:hypothetical protein
MMQEELNQIWDKYRRTLIVLSKVIEENEQLRKQLDLDFTMPQDILDLESKIEAILNKNGQ